MRNSFRATLVGVLLLVVSLAVPAGAAELVYVYEPGCPYCRMWDREIGPVYGKTAEGRRAALMPVDKRDPALASLKLARPVLYTPTFILMEEGLEVGRIEGYPGEDFFWGRLGAMLEKLPQDRKQ